MRNLHQRCERGLAGIPIPRPFTLDAWCAAVSAHRGRALHLSPMPGLSAVAPCGMWVAAHETDYIFYEANTSQLHAEHIILHELGHILSDHTIGTGMADSALAGLLPDLDLSAVQRILGRVNYSTEQEQEAEMLASIVRAKAWAGQGHADQDLTQIVRALRFAD